MKHTLVALLVFLSANALYGQKYAVLYASGKYEKSLKFAEKAIEENNKDLDAYLIKAMSNLHLYLDAETRNDHQAGVTSALSTLQTIKRKDKQHTFLTEHQAEMDSIMDAAYTLALQWLDKEQIKRCSNILDDLIELKPKPEYYYLMGNIRAQEGDTEAAVLHYNDAAAKIYHDAKNGQSPDPELYVVFADLADAIADDHDFYSALSMYNRGIRIFRSKEISDRCFDLISNALPTWYGGYDTLFISRAIQYLDSLPEEIIAPQRFQDLKWEAVYVYYQKLESNSWYNQAIDPLGRLEYFACKDKRTDAADTLMAAMLDETELKITTKGVHVLRAPEKLYAWMRIYGCTRGLSEKDVHIALLDKIDHALQVSDFSLAGEIIYNLSATGFDTKQIAALEKQLFTAMMALSADQLNEVDLYAMSVMFPNNSTGKKLQKDESVRLINTLLDKKDYTAAGQKLRIQMQLDPKDATLKALYKMWIIDDYIHNYMSSATWSDLSGWNGSVETCEAGTLPDSVHKKVLQRLNYFRRLAGVPDNCTFNKEWNRMCMEAALMMTANYSLSHGPPADWSCYTTDGARAAGMSNLSLGYGGAEALTGQVDDAGSNNGAVGHRRWILDPFIKVYGHGSTDDAMALWSLGGKGSAQSDEVYAAYDKTYVAWPSEWYFPSSLLSARWSLSLRGADFDEATVEMYKGNQRIECEVLEPEYGYGLATVVWEPVLSNADIQSESTFKVVVKNIIVESNWDEAKQKYIPVYDDHTYTVTFVAMW